MDGLSDQPLATHSSIDTIGFDDIGWLNARRPGHSEEMRVEERFHRRDYGHQGLLPA
jgi:hypothetical protein